MRLFLDANVLFSAARSTTGRAAALFDLAGTGRCILLTSPFALEEARRNTLAKQPHCLPRFQTLTATVALVPEAGDLPPGFREQAKLPDKDWPILAAAIQAHCDALVTGDRRHFGKLFGKTVARVEILSLALAMERLL